MGLNVVLRYLTSSDFCVGNIFMQCLHLLKRYFVPLPWQFLTQPELQQGSDRLNCFQKHFLMWYAIKINCIYINEQVVSIFSCNLRSDSELNRHLGPAFSVTPARRTLFLAARNFEPVAGNFEPVAPNFVPVHYYAPAQNFDLSTWVTMSVMPPIDNYISIFLLKNRDRP